MLLVTQANQCVKLIVYLGLERGMFMVKAP